MCCPYLGAVVVLLNEGGHDGGGHPVAGPVGGARGSLQQLGTGPHQLEVRLTQVVLAICMEET